MSSPYQKRLEKLLRLARDRAASPHEAATALHKAAQLAQEHGIDLESINLSADSSTPGASPLRHSRAKSDKGQVARHAANLIRKQFGCRVVFLYGREIVIVGPGTFVEVALYAFQYIRRAINSAWKNRSNRRLRDRNGFVAGFAAAISEAMPEAFRNHSLIPDDALETYLSTAVFGREITLHGLPSQKSTISHKAAHAGFIAGRRHGIHGALEA